MLWFSVCFCFLLSSHCSTRPFGLHLTLQLLFSVCIERAPWFLVALETHFFFCWTSLCTTNSTKCSVKLLSMYLMLLLFFFFVFIWFSLAVYILVVRCLERSLFHCLPLRNGLKWIKKSRFHVWITQSEAVPNVHGTLIIMSMWWRATEKCIPCQYLQFTYESTWVAGKNARWLFSPDFSRMTFASAVVCVCVLITFSRIQMEKNVVYDLYLRPVLRCLLACVCVCASARARLVWFGCSLRHTCTYDAISTVTQWNACISWGENG